MGEVADLIDAMMRLEDGDWCEDYDEDPDAPIPSWWYDLEDPPREQFFAAQRAKRARVMARVPQLAGALGLLFKSRH